MRIAMVCDEFYPEIGGASVYTTQLSSALAKLGVEPVVITRAREGPTHEEEVGGARIKRLKGFSLPRANREVSLKLFRDLYQYIKHGSFDVVHGQDIYSTMSLVAIHSARKRAIPSVVTCHSIHKAWGAWRAIYFPVLFTLRRVNRVITVSKSVESFCHALGVSASKTVVVPNGVDPQKFNSRVGGKLMRERLELKREDRLVATAIRLVRRKGIRVLLEAFDLVIAEFPDVRLAVAGWGPEGWRLRSWVKGRGLEERVELLGPLLHEEVAELMAAADVFVLPSTVEAFGLAAVESMAVGTPLVCPRVGGISEFVKDGLNCLMFEPNDPRSLARAIVRLLGDRKLAERLSREGMSTAKKFSWDRTAKLTLKVYEEVSNSCR